MRVAILSELVDPERDVPFSRRIWAIYRDLKSRGCQVEILSTRLSLRFGTENWPGEVIPLRGYAHWRVRVQSPFAAVFLPLGILELVKAFREFRPDVIIITGIGPFILLEALFAAKACATPVVFDVRDSWLLLEAFHPGGIRNSLRQAIEGYALRRGELCVAVTSRQLALIAEGYSLKADKLTLIPSGSDLTPSEVRHGDVEFDLVHAGPPRDYYDTPLLLDSLRLLRQKLPTLRVCFVGVTEELKTAWQPEIDSRGLGSCVELLPPVPHDQLSELLGRCRVGVVSVTRDPHYRIGVSTKTYDYLATGLPILLLAPTDSEQARLVEQLGVGLVADSPSGFADNAYALLSNEIELKELVRHTGVAAINYSWTSLLDGLHQRLVEIVSRHRSG